jgi:flagellar assembly protein FliH
MSESKIIPKEQLTAYQRWELESLHDSAPKQAELQLPTADEIQQIQQQAWNEGFSTGKAEGYQAGLRDGRERGMEDSRRMHALFSALDMSLQQFEQKLVNDVLGLTLDISRQILRESLNAKPELVLAVVREAVASLPQSGQPVQLRLHPADALLVRELMPAELAHEPLRIIEDDRLERGGCQVQSPNSELDATLETRWQRLVKSLGRQDAWKD